jgi:hypothetical protein
MLHSNLDGKVDRRKSGTGNGDYAEYVPIVMAIGEEVSFSFSLKVQRADVRPYTPYYRGHSVVRFPQDWIICLRHVSFCEKEFSSKISFKLPF